MFKFIIDNKSFHIDNHKKNLDKKLEELVSTFEIDENRKCDYLMTIKDKHVLINGNIRSVQLDIDLRERDLYQIFYFFVYYCINTQNKCVIHSTIASKNGKAILLLGTFGAGKTTLSIELEKCGFEINSADHSVVEVVQSGLYFIAGTRRVKYNGINSYLSFSAINKKLKINKVYCLIGVCDNGKVSIENVTDMVRKSKKLWTSMTWVYVNPLQSYNNLLLSQLDCKIYNICKLIAECDFDEYVCRGDVKQLAKVIDDNF